MRAAMQIRGDAALILDHLFQTELAFYKDHICINLRHPTNVCTGVYYADQGKSEYCHPSSKSNSN